MNCNKTRLRLYLLALFLMGCAHIVTQFPFSDFDEPAHFSSIEQIAETGTIPVYGKSIIDPDALQVAGRGVKPRSPSPNYEAQHPPLYYALLAPFEKAMPTVKIEQRLLILRFISYVIALGGIALAFTAAQRDPNPKGAHHSMIGFLLYPVVFPAFFGEFARLGNDSLCLFLTGLLAFLLSRFFKQPSQKSLATAIGLTLGAGLLTKAFFIPILAAVGGFSLWRIFYKRLTDHARSSVGVEVAEVRRILVTAVFTGGWWYVYKVVEYHDLIGGADAISLAEQGGLLTGLEAHFSILAAAHSVLITLQSYLFFVPSWLQLSLPSMLELVPTACVGVIGLFGYMRMLQKTPATHDLWLPVWIYGLFAFGLLHHILIDIAAAGHGQTPGWYLHILMPWGAPALGAGIGSFLEQPRLRVFTVCVIVLTGIIVPAVRLVVAFHEFYLVCPVLWLLAAGGALTAILILKVGRRDLTVSD